MALCRSQHCNLELSGRFLSRTTCIIAQWHSGTMIVPVRPQSQSSESLPWCPADSLPSLPGSPRCHPLPYSYDAEGTCLVVVWKLRLDMQRGLHLDEKDQINVFALILAELLKFRASYYLTTTWLRTQPCAIRLVDECQVGTPFCRTLLYRVI